ncbi:MAG: hypothetical protein ACEQSF_01070 [Solirubrobacteraceae bacterium]
MKLLKVFFVGLVFFTSCSDVVEFSKKDVKRNQLDVFTPKILKLEGSHDLDNSRISILLESSFSNEEYINSVIKNALKENWVLSFKKGKYLIFIKNDLSESNEAIPIIVKIYFLEEGQYLIEIF